MNKELEKIGAIVAQSEFAETKEAGRKVMNVLHDALGRKGVPVVGVLTSEGSGDYIFQVEWPPLRMLEHLNLLKYT